MLEKILLNNFGSSAFFINKAIGWSLRDYSKTNPDWVRNFVETHKDKMNKLSIREASKYIWVLGEKQNFGLEWIKGILKVIRFGTNNNVEQNK